MQVKAYLSDFRGIRCPGLPVQCWVYSANRENAGFASRSCGFEPRWIHQNLSAEAEMSQEISSERAGHSPSYRERQHRLRQLGGSPDAGNKLWECSSNSRAAERQERVPGNSARSSPRKGNEARVGGVRPSTPTQLRGHMDKIETLINKLNVQMSDLQVRLNQLHIDALVAEAELRTIRRHRDDLVDATKNNGPVS